MQASFVVRYNHLTSPKDCLRNYINFLIDSNHGFSLTSESENIVQRLFSIDSISSVKFWSVILYFLVTSEGGVFHIERIRWFVYLTLLLYVTLFLFFKEWWILHGGILVVMPRVSVFIMAKIPWVGYRVSQSSDDVFIYKFTA